MENLALFLDGHVIPEHGAFLETQHSGNCADQARFSAPISAFENEQFAAFQRK